ncbi:uncharacterized protein [Clytia hemisphaerica]|uniref:Uncharacterized protein n=1 Tax=Clytia hemisphaerica TaxID=252671 RepID=A0A7M5WUB9_9CNID
MTNTKNKALLFVSLCIVTYIIHNEITILDMIVDLKYTTINFFNDGHILNGYEVYSFLQSHDVRISNQVIDKTDFVPFCRHPSISDNLKSFKSHLHWKDRARNSSMLRTQANISQLHLVIYKHKTKDNYIGKLHIQTFNRRGEMKFNGGDYWRATIIGGSMRASINIQDKSDGTYTGWFPVLFPGIFSVHVVLEFSNYEGITDPPLDWFSKGSIQGRFQPDGIIGPVDQFLNEDGPISQFRITGTHFQTENTLNKELFGFDQQCDTFINTECGFWKESNFKGYRPHKIKNIPKKIMPRESKHLTKNVLSNQTKQYQNKQLDTLWIYGDSQGRRFYWSLIKYELCTKLFKKCDHTYTWTYKHFNSNSHDDRYKFTGDDFNETRILNDIKFDITRPETRSSRSVVLINFGLHIVLSVGLERGFRLFDSFIDMVKKIRVNHRPDKVPLIIWKTTTLPVLENVPSVLNSTGLRFMTKQRIDAWNSYTITAACKSDLPILAVHNHPPACPFKPVDWVHFEYQVFRKVEDELKTFLIHKYGIP